MSLTPRNRAAICRRSCRLHKTIQVEELAPCHRLSLTSQFRYFVTVGVTVLDRATPISSFSEAVMS
jgi:hypothetical protein